MKHWKLSLATVALGAALSLPATAQDEPAVPAPAEAPAVPVPAALTGLFGFKPSRGRMAGQKTADDPGEIAVFYQWQGSYSKEEMGKEVAKVEEYLDANRKRFDIEQVYSRFSEQGWAQTRIDLSSKDPARSAEIEEALRKEYHQALDVQAVAAHPSIAALLRRQLEEINAEIARLNGYLHAIVAHEQKADSDWLQLTFRFVDQDAQKLDYISRLIARGTAQKHFVPGA